MKALALAAAGVLIASTAALAQQPTGFNAIKPTKKNDKTYLTLNTTKDALKGAPGL